MNPNANTDVRVILPTGSTPRTFEDRCRAARQTIYAEQRRRNNRFEHLRRLLCEPTPKAEPVQTLPTLHVVDCLEPLPDTRSPRCTCCAYHAHPLFKSDAPRNKDDQAHTYLKGGWALRECPDCIRNFYADRKAAEVGEPVKGQCMATLHRWCLEQPDSSTVKTAEETRLEADTVILAESEQSEIDDMVARYWATPRDGRRDFLAEHEWLKPHISPDTRPVGAITCNVKTGWVTYTSSQAKARVTLNRTTLTVSLRYGRLEPPNARKRYATLADATLAVNRLHRWAEEWLAARGIEPNVAVASTERSAAPLDFTRTLRDRLSRQGIDANVRIIR